MKKLIPWKLLIASLEKNIPVMMLYVLESKGSSPGRQGFFMAVNAAGEMEGSIGGGIMEHKFVELAKERLLNIEQGTYLSDGQVKKQVHNKSSAADQSGMICSGEQTIWLYHVKQDDLVTIQRIVCSWEQNKNGTLILSPEGVQFDEVMPLKDFDYTFQSEVNWRYKEKTGYKNRLFIIGGGHCSLALSALMRGMDFYISVYDERNGLKTLVENEMAHEKHFINNYEELQQLIPSGSSHYVVIMTFGYRTDDLAIRALQNKEFKYTGVMGSQKKMEKLFTDYRNEGIAEVLLQRIHTPIGLAIKSQTPEEIAVSIAAEIIKIKNE